MDWTANSRRTSHLLLELHNNKTYLICSLGSRSDTQVISIERQTGALSYRGFPGVDLFPTEQAALSAVTGGNPGLVKNKTVAKAIIGYLVVGSTAFIVLATKVRPDVTLFGGHRVFTVLESQWVRLPLSYRKDECKTEVKQAELLKDYPLDGLHYYCETYDLTRSFPSSCSVRSYDKDFVWNEFLASPFVALGLADWTVVLLQGMAISRVVARASEDDMDSASMTLSLFTRKSRVNPGTRYHSRGLNEKGGAGNEMECEMLLWAANGDRLQFASNVWRRGTVPLWWKTQLKSSTDGTPEMVVREENPYQHTDTYYSRLLERYGQHPIRCFSLLRCGPPGNTEIVLGEHYQQSIKHVRKLIDIDVQLTNFDWHHNLKQLGMKQSVEGLWAVLKSELMSQGVTFGELRAEKVTTTATGTGQGDTTEADAEHAVVKQVAHIKFFSRQTGITRYNCADSLDRTNICTFFVAVQLLIEQTRLLEPFFWGIDIETEMSGFLDIRFPMVTLGFDDAIEHIQKRPLMMETLSDFFVFNGDVCSLLYTNTPAMHTTPMREFSPNMPSAPSDIKVVLSRRFQNFYHDNQRQQLFEMFLGLYLDKYFPSNVQGITWVSGPPACSISAVPCAFPDTSGNHLLLSRPDSRAWICPPGHEVAGIYVHLSQPAYVTEIAITIRHGPSDNTSPKYADIFVGPYLNDTSVITQELQIPRCNDMTTLRYVIDRSGSTDDSRSAGGQKKLYNFEGGRVKSEDGPPSRVVYISFRGGGEAVMTLGAVQVFGRVAGRRGGDPATAHHQLLSHQAAVKLHEIQHSVGISSVRPEMPPRRHDPTIPGAEISALERAQMLQDEGDSTTTTAATATPGDPAAEGSKAAQEGEEEDGDTELAPAGDATSESSPTVRGTKAKVDPSPDGDDGDDDDTSGLVSPKPSAARNTTASGEEGDDEGAQVFTPDVGSGNTSMAPKAFLSPSASELDLANSDDESESDISRDDGSSPKAVDGRSGSRRDSQAAPPGQGPPPLAPGRTRGPSATAVPGLTGRGRTASTEVDDYLEARTRTMSLQSQDGMAPETPNERTTDANGNALPPTTLARYHELVSTKLDQSNTRYRQQQGDGSGRPRTSSDVSTPGALLSFLDTLELEHERLLLGITPAQRDKILVSQGLQVALFDPHRFISHHDEKIEAALRKSPKFKSGNCRNPKCGTSLSFTRARHCHHCRQRFCANCFSSEKVKIPEFEWNTPTHGVCKSCHDLVRKQERVLAALLGAIKPSNNGAIDPSSDHAHALLSVVQQANTIPDRTWQADQKLIPFSEYPDAGVLVSVPTHAKSPPVESIFFPPHLVPVDIFWYAPPSTIATEVIVVLSARAKVSKLVMRVDSMGYTAADCPQVALLAGDAIPYLKECASWDLAQVHGSAAIPPASVLEFTFETPVECRLFSFQFCLPQQTGSGIPGGASSTSSPLAEGHMDKPFLHCGRIQILGQPVADPPSFYTLNPAQQQAYDNTLQGVRPLVRSQIRPLWTQYRAEKRVLHVGISAGIVSGFGLSVQHEADGVDSQVKTVCATAFTTDAKGQITSRTPVGRFTIPKTPHNTLLLFDLPQAVTANILTFELLDNYGALDYAPGKFSLYRHQQDASNS